MAVIRTPTELKLDPLPVRRTHEFAAGQIRRLILLRVIGPGERLPSEVELGIALDVSHVTIRAALRLLEAEGLLEIRRGRRGGAYITGVPALGSSAHLEALRAAADRLEDSLEFRRLLEPEACAAATRRASSGTRAELQALYEDVLGGSDGDDASFMATDTAFHLALARASGNPMIVEAIERALAELAPALQALPETGAWRERSSVEHAEILRCVLGSEPETARAAMAAHVAVTERAVTQLIGELLPARDWPLQEPSSMA